MSLFNSRLKFFAGKLTSKRLGPLTVVNMYPRGEIELGDHKKRRFTMKDQWLKYFYVGGLRAAKVEATIL